MMKKNNFLSKLFVILVMLFNYLPIIVVVVYSFNASKYGNWEGFSLKWYSELLDDDELLTAAWLSLKIGLLTATASVVIGTWARVSCSRASAASRASRCTPG